MIKRDFHGYKVNEALQEMEILIGQARLNNKQETVEIITGHGPIRQAIIELFAEYDIDEHEDIGNSGVIIATVE